MTNRKVFANIKSHQICAKSIKTAQELMGHNDYEVTANVYTHGDNDSKVAAASLQNEY